MNRALLPALAATLALWAAQPAAAQGCDVTDGADNCVRFLGCIGEAGRWFDGTAIGRVTGTVAARTDDGVTCTGRFTQQTGLFGTAFADCSDGSRIEVVFTYQDAYTGTALGYGQMTGGQTGDGAKVRSWSGRNILEFLRRADPEGKPRLPCGTAPLLIS